MPVLSAPAEIYGLFDPRTGALRYIGKANCSQKRYNQHVRDCHRRHTPVYLWLRELLSLGLLPELTVLEHAADWCESEKRLIAAARAQGQRLLNVAPGGTQPFCPVDVCRANGRNSDGKGAKLLHSDPRRKRIWQIKRSMGIALKKGWVSEETKEKMRYCARKRPDLFGSWANVT